MKSLPSLKLNHNTDSTPSIPPHIHLHLRHRRHTADLGPLLTRAPPQQKHDDNRNQHNDNDTDDDTRDGAALELLALLGGLSGFAGAGFAQDEVQEGG
jgi:hypothetical protein